MKHIRLLQLRKNIDMKHFILTILLILIIFRMKTCTSKPDDEIVQGIWQGTLVFPGAIELRVAFTITKTPDSSLTVTQLRPDQRDTEIPVTNIVLEDRHLYREVASINGSFVVMLVSSGLPGYEYHYPFEESIGRALGESKNSIRRKRLIQERVLAV